MLKSKFCSNAALLLFILISVFPCGAEKWSFSASEVSAGKNRENIILNGNARVESDDIKIRANNLELGGEDYNRITGGGNVILEKKQDSIIVSCQRFEYDRDNGIIHFRRQVEFTDEEENIVIRCESMELFENEDIVIMQVAVRLIKDDTICRGEFASFNQKDNILEISGKPVIWRNEDKYQANLITVNLDTDDIAMEGAVSGALTTENKESNDSDIDDSGAESPADADDSVESGKDKPGKDKSSKDKSGKDKSGRAESRLDEPAAGED